MILAVVIWAAVLGALTIVEVHVSPPAMAAPTSASAPDAPKWTDQLIALSALGTLAFTAVLAVSTVALWRATKRLAAGAEAQAADIRTTALAAQRSADVAERALHATQRAHVFAEPRWSVRLASEAAEDIHSVGFWMELTNGGNTPTQRMINRSSIYYFVTGLGIPFDYDRAFPTDIPEIPVTLGVRASTTTDEQVFPVADQMQRVLDGTAELYLFGWAEYDDVFAGSPRHGVEWCFRVRFEGRFRRNELQIRFASQPEHNRIYDCPPETARSQGR